MGDMNQDRRAVAKAVAIGGAFVAAIGVSSVGCSDDEVNERNIGTKLAAALCGAEAACCANQGAPLSADARTVCEATAPAFVAHPNGYVFNHDVAVACLKAAAAFQCRYLPGIQSLCRLVFSDPAFGAEVAPRFGPGGAPCQSLYDCSVSGGLSCILDSPSSSTGTCRKVAGTGGSCSVYTDCMLGYYCDSMTCMPESPDGAACTFNICKSGFCSGGVCVARTDCVID